MIFSILCNWLIFFKAKLKFNCTFCLSLFHFPFFGFPTASNSSNLIDAYFFLLRWCHGHSWTLFWSRILFIASCLVFQFLTAKMRKSAWTGRPSPRTTHRNTIMLTGADLSSPRPWRFSLQSFCGCWAHESAVQILNTQVLYKGLEPRWCRISFNACMSEFQEVNKLRSFHKTTIAYSLQSFLPSRSKTFHLPFLPHSCYLHTTFHLKSSRQIL